MPKVRGCGREQLLQPRGQGQSSGGATTRPRPGVAAGRSYHTPEARRGSWEELPARPRPGVLAERSNPRSKEWWLCGCRKAKRSYSAFKVRRGSGEEITLVQSREQRLHFARAAVKRYPTSKVRETYRGPALVGSRD